LGERARRSGLAILIADPHEGLRPEQIECPAGWLLVIGGETEGYSADWRTLGGRPVHIPMADEVESLNSAVAAGIILFCLAEAGVPGKKPGRGGRVRSN
jgi:tRNA G18 (ribose-2'-O)-methylase SpoU